LIIYSVIGQENITIYSILNQGKHVFHNHRPVH